MKCFILYSLSKSQLPCVFTRLDCWLRGLMASKDVLWAVYAGSICLWSWCHPMPSQLWARRAPGAGWCHRSGKTCDGLWRLPCWGSQPLAEFSQCASPPMFLDSPLCLCAGSYQLASAGHQHQSAHQRLPLLGQAVPSLGSASWLMPSQCSRWQVEEKAPFPGLQKGLGPAVEPSVPRRFQEQLFQVSPLGPRCAQAAQGPWLSGGHVAVILGAPCSALHLLMGQPLLPALIPCSSKKQTFGAASPFARNVSSPACAHCTRSAVSSSPAMHLDRLTVFLNGERLTPLLGASF